MAWPTAEEIAEHFVAVGLLSSVPGDLDEISAIRASMIERWERESGFSPYLKLGSPATVSISVRDGLQYVHFPSPVWLENIEVSLDGIELVRDSSYRLVGIREPYRGIELAGTGLDLAVNALFGAVAGIPDDVFRAFLAGCAAEFATQRPTMDVNFIEQRVGEVTVKRGAEEGSAVSLWRSQWDRAIHSYGRRRVIL
jgi:hypothetical protein